LRDFGTASSPGLVCLVCSTEAFLRPAYPRVAGATTEHHACPNANAAPADLSAGDDDAEFFTPKHADMSSPGVLPLSPLVHGTYCSHACTAWCSQLVDMYGLVAPGCLIPHISGSHGTIQVANQPLANPVLPLPHRIAIATCDCSGQRVRWQACPCGGSGSAAALATVAAA